MRGVEAIFSWGLDQAGEENERLSKDREAVVEEMIREVTRGL